MSYRCSIVEVWTQRNGCAGRGPGIAARFGPSKGIDTYLLATENHHITIGLSGFAPASTPWVCNAAISPSGNHPCRVKCKTPYLGYNLCCTEWMQAKNRVMKYTQYFLYTRQRSDRRDIKLEWIQHVIDHPIREEIQIDGRIRRWAKITEAENRYLRVILLEDGETVHNAFFDRSFSEDR